MHSIHNKGTSVVAEMFIRTKLERLKSTNAWLQYQKMCI